MEIDINSLVSEMGRSYARAGVMSAWRGANRLRAMVMRPLIDLSTTSIMQPVKDTVDIARQMLGGDGGYGAFVQELPLATPPRLTEQAIDQLRNNTYGPDPHDPELRASIIVHGIAAVSLAQNTPEFPPPHTRELAGDMLEALGEEALTVIDRVPEVAIQELFQAAENPLLAESEIPSAES